MFKAISHPFELFSSQTPPILRSIEKSFGIAVMAYLFMIRVCRDELHPGQSWSVAHLQYVFRLRVITNQVEHNVKAKFGRGRKAA